MESAGTIAVVKKETAKELTDVFALSNIPKINQTEAGAESHQSDDIKVLCDRQQFHQCQPRSKQAIIMVFVRLKNHRLLVFR